MIGSIVIGCDHSGLRLKQAILAFLESNYNLDFNDIGTHSDNSVDYPLIANKLVNTMMQSKSVAYGLLICGTGIGMSIVANRHPGIRAAVVTDPTTAMLTRLHNNANVLCLGARITTELIAIDILKSWIMTEFEGGRHAKRLSQF